MNRRSFLAAAALGPLALPAQAAAPPALPPLTALSLEHGPTPAALRAAAEALRVSEAWLSVTPTTRASSKLRRAAARDAEAASAALKTLLDWLDAVPAATLERWLDRLRLEPGAERAWRRALRGGASPALDARVDARVDEALSGLLAGPPLPQVRAWIAGARRPAPPLPQHTARRAPPGQRVVVGAGLGAFGGYLLSRGVVIMATGGVTLWPVIFAGMGALILALGVGVMVVAIRELRAQG